MNAETAVEAETVFDDLKPEGFLCGFPREDGRSG
jgi:hypothetical protein